MSRPRNERRDELSVPARNGGKLTGGPSFHGVWVNAGYGHGITVTVSAENAERFGRWLIECARVSRSNR